MGEGKKKKQHKRRPRPKQKLKVPKVNSEENETTTSSASATVNSEPPKWSGFNKFHTAYPSLCESTASVNSGSSLQGEPNGLVAPNSAMQRLSVSLSQPCLAERTEGPTMIFPFLYLGSQRDSLDDSELKRCGITDVINLSTSLPRSSYIANDENFLRIPVNDSYQEKLSPHFENAFEHLERIRLTNRVCLIHCLAGISRSPTLAISYVMRHKKMSSDEAYKFVKEKRPSISPNFNFMGQLLEYEEKLIKLSILKPESSSKRVSDKPLSLLQDAGQEVLCPAKVPKSASSHCVFSSNDNSNVLSSQHLNENGKRGLLLNSAGSSELSSTQSLTSPIMDRPKALLLPLSLARRPKELSSPSTEMSRLSFTPTEIESPVPLALTNPCFFSPTTQSKPLSRNGSCSQSSNDGCGCVSNPCFDSSNSTSTGSTSGTRSSCINKLTGFFKKAPPMRLRMPAASSPLSPDGQSSASRPDCLRSSGVVLGSAESKRHSSTKLRTTPLSTTKEEPDAESPESGFQDGGYKSTPETEPDRASISSASSIEITVK
ncbi:hypothetical protein WR25_04975 [Diploscapter pachys]|uniref:protein-tyrosine-phosphatase n=1 Tax=Diploscapter pachys TaxID=2018661 RepID=A0A2A2J4V9_9BILA|nr:hypothetical protein WR25_04975 [Diploscapter pachys]